MVLGFFEFVMVLDFLEFVMVLDFWVFDVVLDFVFFLGFFKFFDLELCDFVVFKMLGLLLYFMYMYNGWYSKFNFIKQESIEQKFVFI